MNSTTFGILIYALICIFHVFLSLSRSLSFLLSYLSLNIFNLPLYYQTGLIPMKSFCLSFSFMLLIDYSTMPQISCMVKLSEMEISVSFTDHVNKFPVKKKKVGSEHTFQSQRLTDITSGTAVSLLSIDQ